MKTILVIEDNAQMRGNIAEILELAPYKVVQAADGKQGVAIARQTRPDLILCDIMMPELDGYGVLHILGNDPELADTPFLFLSAKAEAADFRFGMNLGADDYLTKPFDELELLMAIEGRLKRFQAITPAVQPPTTNHPLQPDELNQFLDNARQVGNLQSLSADRKVHVMRKKQFVYSEGDEPTRLYFIKSGTVKTVRTNADGKELITGLYNPGDFLGYLPLLEHTDYTDSAVTLTDAELVYIPKDDFLQLLLANPLVSGQFIKLLAGRVSERETQLLSMAYNSLRRRVADTPARTTARRGHSALPR
ncbi:response regulator [Spirosoma luteum]|uniref:response regulator n=1 Tax=Spirosoma luteum TaxID=431553 RepID=UPI00037F15D6